MKILRKIQYGIQRLIILSQILAGRSKYWTIIHFAIIDHSFYREMYGVTSGIAAHKKRTIEGNTSYLRRCIHRIEKGLSTNNRRSKFAERYILEAIIAFKKEFDAKGYSETITWAFNIFNEYFKNVEDSPQIEKAFRLFQQHISTINIRQIEHREMITAGKRNGITISYEDFRLLNLRRRSVRSFKNEIVEREKIEQALKVALQAPSACNRQPFSFRVVDDKEKILEVGELPLGATTFYEDVPMMVYVIGNLSAYEYTRDRHTIYVDSALVVMNFILSLETLGLSSCVINWPDVKNAEIRLAQFFNLQPYERCVICIAIGYANDESFIPISEKKDIESIIEYY